MRQLDVQNWLRIFNQKLDGCTNYGNILKNVRIDLMTIWNLNGHRWMLIKCKIKLKKWDKDYSHLKLMIENAAHF